MTGCPNGCARPYLAEIGLVGKGPGRYNLYLGAAFDGSRLSKLYAEDLQHEQIIAALDPLFAAYAKEREPNERFGEFVIRAGFVARPATARTSTPTWEPSAPHERSRAHAGCPHHLPVLRRRLRHPGDAGRAGRRDDRGRSEASGEFRPAVLERRGARRNARARDAAAASDAAPARRHARAHRLGQALGRVADGFRRIIERDGPDAVAFYLSGQLLTEDYYVANKLMKGFLGSANVDTNSRLCMASSVAGHKRAFGADTVPGLYEDLDQADLIVLVGSNAAWCHPVLFQRMQENRRKRGAKLVVIDPRRTATADEADLHLAIKPGMDTALFSGLLVRLADRDVFDPRYVAQPHHRFRRGAEASERDRARTFRDRRAEPGCSRPKSRASTSCSPPRRASSPATRRGSISRRKALTRLAQSSTAISRRAASAGPAWGRSR